MNNLILTRRIGESIMIGDDIEIEIIEVKGNKVKLGFKADKDISIHRKEVYDSIKKEQLMIEGSREGLCRKTSRGIEVR